MPAGSSAVESLLKEHDVAAVDVFVIWEPILSTDLRAPGRWALSTLPDRRVRQYWDPSHVISGRLAADARAPQPALECCTRGETIWDAVAVYRPGATWTAQMPPAVVFNGPVIDMIAAIEDIIRTPSATTAH